MWATSGITGVSKLLFIAALKSGATGIILSHNHPSGNLALIEAGINITRKIKAGCNLPDILLLDHVILTVEKYYSFGDEGLL
jgi:DNA repair protein RadC